MRNTLLCLALLAITLRLPAQTNPPVRLALVAESPDASVAADILTTELSGHKDLQLLERNEIEKVYREQGLSAGNKDYLKLGQVLGADGLLLLEVARSGANEFLNVRVIAVKPGVVLVDESFPWPVKDLTAWSAEFTKHLEPFLPKLTVLIQDAIPISVVNLRSAISSVEAAETERQLKLLLIQRLSHERQLFVLERQKMQLLSDENDLKLDESGFWNGSYLLEGVVDQNGYSEDTVTINARLTPPRGGAPVPIEVSASRTNLLEAINQLAVMVNEALKIKSAAMQWNAADEAAQYYNEAKWAMRWGMLSEAQAAADSAWALGKRDLECALVRVKSYLLPTSASIAMPDNLDQSYDDVVAYDPNGNPIESTRVKYEASKIQSDIKEMLAQHPWGIDYKETTNKNILRAPNDKTPLPRDVQYSWFKGPPDPRDIDQALYVLKLYEESGRTLPDAGIKATSSRLHIPNWNNPDWSQLGLDELVAASRVLQEFNFAPVAQKPVAEKLADLRMAARSIAGLIDTNFSTTPSDYDTLTMTERNIFRCKIDWGCFWQDTPEDCLAMYRELMGSPVFDEIMDGLVSRQLLSPRLVGWNEADRKHIPNVWEDYVQELCASTNSMMQLAGKAFKFRNSDGKEDAAAGWAALQPEIQTIESNNMKLQAFEKQKQFLRQNKVFYSYVQPNEIADLFIFGFKDYTKLQAMEMQPLLSAYKSNLLAQVTKLPLQKGGWARMGVIDVGRVEAEVDRIVNQPSMTPPSQPPPKLATAKPVAVIKMQATVPTVLDVPDLVTNIIKVKKFVAIPLDGLLRMSGLETVNLSRATITAHHWQEGKLLLNFRCSFIRQYTVFGFAIAILDPTTEHWDVISYPEVDFYKQSDFYHHSALFHGDLFNCDGGMIERYDFQKAQWQILNISDGNNYELFPVNGHLYAANGKAIFEIIEGGKKTHILASTRRQPPVSVLDTLDNLGIPVLFEGTNHLLQAYVKSTIYRFDKGDWQKADRITSDLAAEVFEDGVLFRDELSRYPDYDLSLFQYTPRAASPELCLWQQYHYLKDGHTYLPVPNATPPAQPAWKIPSGLSFSDMAGALSQSNLYLLADHFDNEGQSIAEPYNSKLFCFSRGLSLPQELLLKFDNLDGCQPLTMKNPHKPDIWPEMPPAWLLPTKDFLFFGEQPINNGTSCKAGVWILPNSQLEPAIAAQKQIQIAEQEREAAQAVTAMKQAAAAKEQAKKGLLAKYDHNHNGIIDPDEKEEALDDASFIKYSLDAIDANHNGWLDAEKLVWFDANNNKILEPKEQAGIEIAQHLLAERLLKKYDANGDGLLDRQEFNELAKASIAPKARSFMPGMQPLFPDNNHDGYVDLGELETLLRQQLRSGIRGSRMAGAAPFTPMSMDPNQPFDPRQLFKAVVDAYWQNPGVSLNHPGTKNQTPIGAGNTTNGLEPTVKP